MKEEQSKQPPLLIIREATVQDLPALRTWAELHTMRELLPAANTHMIVAVDNFGVIVAYLLIWPDHIDSGILHIQVLEVHPWYRRKGIGRTLVESLQQRPDVHGLTAEWVQWEAVPFWNAIKFQADGDEEWIEGQDKHAGDFTWEQ